MQMVQLNALTIPVGYFMALVLHTGRDITGNTSEGFRLEA